MRTFYQCLDVAIRNLKRLNQLRIKGKLNKVTWQEFFLYKRIVKANDTSVYTKEVKDIIDK